MLVEVAELGVVPNPRFRVGLRVLFGDDRFHIVDAIALSHT